MNTQLLDKIEKSYMKKSLPNMSVGDTIEVTTIIRDEKGKKRRTQPFRGLIVTMRGSGTRQTMTIRKISAGIGVEKIFPIHSPNVELIKILKKGKVRQANIGYMRKRIGRRAMKIAESDEVIVPMEFEEEAKEEKKIITEQEAQAKADEANSQDKPSNDQSNDKDKSDLKQEGKKAEKDKAETRQEKEKAKEDSVEEKEKREKDEAE